MTLGQFLLFLHILLAILAFGPTFAFPLISGAGGKEPQHGNFALRVSEIIEKRLVIPAAALLPLIGAWMIFERGWDLWASEWLWIAILIYTATFFYAVTLQRTTLHRLIEITKNPPPASEGASGPPPEMERLVKRMQVGGMLMGLAVVTVLLLMVWKPGGELVGP